MLNFQPVTLWPDALLEQLAATGEVPIMSVIRPQHANGSAVLVFPGGGYVVHAEHEAEPVAEWLAGLGFVAFVLRYRLHPNHKHPAALQDAAQALRTVRAAAVEWNVDPQRIGVLGFSAGGHLAATLATNYDAEEAKQGTPLDHISARPDFQVLVYPVITLHGEGAHVWCAEALFGPNPDQALAERWSSHRCVTEQTPPAFLVHTADDDVSCMNSLLMAQALKRASVPFELHIYERGGHGYGLAPDDPVLGDWPTRCAAWLAKR